MKYTVFKGGGWWNETTRLKSTDTTVKTFALSVWVCWFWTDTSPHVCVRFHETAPGFLCRLLSRFKDLKPRMKTEAPAAPRCAFNLKLIWINGRPGITLRLRCFKKEAVFDDHCFFYVENLRNVFICEPALMTQPQPLPVPVLPADRRFLHSDDV